MPGDLNERVQDHAAGCFYRTALFFANLHLWEEAAELCRQALAVAPRSKPVHAIYRDYAITAAACENSDVYRRVTGEMYERYITEANAQVREDLILALCAAPNPGVDPELVAQLADSGWQSIDTLRGG